MNGRKFISMQRFLQCDDDLVQTVSRKFMFSPLYLSICSLQVTYNNEIFYLSTYDMNLLNQEMDEVIRGTIHVLFLT